MKRYLKFFADEDTQDVSVDSTTTVVSKKKLADSVKDDSVISVLLNPTADDSLSDTVQLSLCLGYGQNVLEQSRPLADYLWYSAENRPPLKLLPRVKNPISREGDKPAGESSIIGAF